MDDHDETSGTKPEINTEALDDRAAESSVPAELDPPARSPEPVAWNRRRSTATAVAAVLVVGMFGIWFAVGHNDETVSTGAGGVPSSALWGHRWQAGSIDEGGKERKLVGPAGGQLILDATREGRISFNGCNGGSGSGRLEGDHLVMEPITSTDMACVDADGAALMDQDAWMSTFLTSKPRVQIDGRHLTLSTADVTMELIDLGKGTSTSTIPGDPNDPVSNDPNSPLPDPGSGSTVPGPAVDPAGPGGSVGGGSSASPGAAGIWGERWEITQIGTGPGASGGVGGPATTPAVSRPVPDRNGSAPVLDGRTDGRISYSGCNGGSGAAHLDGDRLVVGPVMGTKMACGGADGEALMAQDATLAAILEADPSVRIIGDHLTLTSKVGTISATRVDS